MTAGDSHAGDEVPGVTEEPHADDDTTVAAGRAHGDAVPGGCWVDHGWRIVDCGPVNAKPRGPVRRDDL